MTTAQIREIRDITKRNIVELSNVALDALATAESATRDSARLTTDLTAAQAEIASLTEALRVAQESNVATPVVTGRVPQANLSSGGTTYAMTPRDMDTSKVVRFLSKNSSGGLANIKAAMTDGGLNAKRLRLEGSTYTPNEDVLLINWGAGFEMPANLSGFTGRHLNPLVAVKIAANKLKTFEALKANSELATYIPEFEVNRTNATAASWAKTYVRETLFGHSGEGIQVVTQGNTIPLGLPLYVQGLNIKHEYRVHTVNGFTKIQKKARLGTEAPNMEVRNLDGGWTFVNTFTLGERGREELHNLATKVIGCIGLDFGAVDIVRTEENEWKVLEVNTAPGVTAESNIEWYSKALLSI